jgi:hypothetical protein
VATLTPGLPGVACSCGVAEVFDLRTWLTEQCAEYTFNVGGVFQRESDYSSWPLEAAGPIELEERLAEGGHLLPLPKEPAALANVLETSIVSFLMMRALLIAGAQVRQGTERGYPDLEVGGSAFGGGFHAVDVKGARRPANRRQTQSRITLYTGNTYFKWPDLHWPGTLRAFSEYSTHLDVIMIYTLNTNSNARVEDLEIIVQEQWRIASRERSSTTGEYIGRSGNSTFGRVEGLTHYGPLRIVDGSLTSEGDVPSQSNFGGFDQSATSLTVNDPAGEFGSVEDDLASREFYARKPDNAAGEYGGLKGCESAIGEVCTDEADLATREFSGIKAYRSA